jgi:TRAP-type uncharacterized transport system fused permease subunit
MKGSATEIISAVATAIVGVVFLGAACAGYVFRTLNWGKRGVLGLALVLWEWNGSSATKARVAELKRQPSKVKT